MRVNLISYDNGYDNSSDILAFAKTLYKSFKNKAEVEYYNYFDEKTLKCADVNIMIGYINNIHFKYAAVNIFLPITVVDWNTNWDSYLQKFDYFLAKNDRIIKYLVNKKSINKTKIHNIGWCGVDRSYLPSEILPSKDKKRVEDEIPDLTTETQINETAIYGKLDDKQYKSYDDWLAFIGISDHRNAKYLIHYWKTHSDMPKLHLVISEKYLKTFYSEELPANIVPYFNQLSIEQHRNLINLCGVHLCLLNENVVDTTLFDAMSAKSVLITTDYPANMNWVDETSAYLVKWNKKKLSGTHLDEDDFDRVINKVRDDININIIADDNRIINMVNNAKDLYTKHYMAFNEKFKGVVHEIFSSEEVSKKKKEYWAYIKSHAEKEYLLDDDKLPNISLITLTYNRQHLFKLSKYNWVSSSYPTKKIEWIIVDDSDNDIDNDSDIPSPSIEEQLPANYQKLNIKYIKLDSKQSIGNKRNIAIENASNDILVMMDDDDYYKSDSFKMRVCHLLSESKRNSEIKCIASTRIGCFEINKLISFMNVPPYELPLSERTSEASYCFYKSFWEERKFEDTNRGEGIAFLKERENNMFELECEYVLVSLLHKNNSGGKKLPSTEANGCHYGWSDKLFTFITNLDKVKK